MGQTDGQRNRRIILRSDMAENCSLFIISKTILLRKIYIAKCPIFLMKNGKTILYLIWGRLSSPNMKLRQAKYIQTRGYGRCLTLCSLQAQWRKRGTSQNHGYPITAPLKPISHFSLQCARYAAPMSKTSSLNRTLGLCAFKVSHRKSSFQDLLSFILYIYEKHPLPLFHVRWTAISDAGGRSSAF